MEKRIIKYLEDTVPSGPPGICHYDLHTPGDTPVQGCYSMLHIITATEYAREGVHTDHEGFFVCSGTGTFKLEGKEYHLKPGCAMYAPAGMPHTLKSDGGELVVFIYHFPA